MMLRTPITAIAFVALTLAGTTVNAAEPPKTKPPFALPVTAEPAHGTVFDAGVLYRDLTRGIYEIVFNPHDGLLYVASALSHGNVSGGAIYKLDAQTLQPVGAIYTDLRNFGLALSPDGKTLYTTNSVQHALTAIDLEKNQVIARLRFDDKDKDGNPFGARQVVYDNRLNLLYVGAVGDPAVIWVVDPQTMTLRHKIENTGKWMTGLLLHPSAGILYAANGGGEILVIDTADFSIQKRFKPAGEHEALLLNMSFDSARDRILVTDTSKLKTVLIVDAQTGEKVGELKDAGESMAILHNPKRQEIYLSNRERGTVSILDAQSHALKRTIKAPPHPNSLALSPDGNTLYVTIKTPFTESYAANGTGRVARINLAETDQQAASQE